MKKSLLVTLFTYIAVLCFAQTTTETESDSLFKAFLMKTKGVKFEEQKAQNKDSAVVSPSAISKKVAPSKNVVKDSPAKVDTLNRGKTVIPNKRDTVVNAKKDTAKVAPSKNVVKDSPAKVDTLNRGKAVILNKRDTVVNAKKDTATKVVPIPVVSSTPAKADVKPGLHKFKEYNNNYTLEAERKGTVVKLYLRMDDIEQYAEVILVRSQAELGNFTDVKHIPIIQGANKFEYVETEDRYPLPTKVGAAYKIRAITKDGAIRMFPAITLEPGNK
jgi:hypothetical protein